MEDEFPILIIFPFNDLHGTSGTVLELFCKYNNRIGFHHDLHQDFVSHIVLSLCQCHHTTVGGLRGITMDGGNYRVTGSGAFCDGQSFFGGTHFPNPDHVRMLTKNTL